MQKAPLMKIFIGYGGSKAEEVASNLTDYLRKEELNVFFANPKGHDLRPGLTEEEVKAEIRKNLLECDIIVFVCHNETPDSIPAKEEIKFILEKRLNGKTIIFSRCEHCIPEIGQNLWNPLHFPPEKAEESFCRLQNEIFRMYIATSLPPEIRTEILGVS